MRLTFSLKSVSKSYFIRKVIPTRHSGNHAAYTYSTSPAMVFHFLSPGVERNMQDRPAWLPEYPAAPFHATATPGRRSGCRVLRQRYHYHPDFKTACQRCPMPGMPLIFFLLLLRSLVPPASKSCHILLSRQIFLREALPSSSSNVPDVLCPYILIFRSGRYKTARTFIVKVRCLPICL